MAYHFLVVVVATRFFIAIGSVRQGLNSGLNPPQCKYVAPAANAAPTVTFAAPLGFTITNTAAPTRAAFRMNLLSFSLMLLIVVLLRNSLNYHFTRIYPIHRERHRLSRGG
jgi:hypothetical protein